MSRLMENIHHVRQRIYHAAQRVGRDPAYIVLVAVTKGVEMPLIEEAIDNGIAILGENRVQEAVVKSRHITKEVSWHLVGHLQTNKVKQAVEIFDLIHSVDTFRVAQEIDRRANKLEKFQKVLLQVNTSGEESKFGVNPSHVPDLIEKVIQLEHVDVQGLMTIGPFTPNLEEVRPSFRQLRQLADEVMDRFPGLELEHLSMGMTDDFEVAIEEGATMVRIGRALFR